MGGGATGIVGKRNLLAGVSIAALAIACCLPTPVSAGEYTAATRGELDDQIRAANADGDASSIIRLTGNVGVGAPTSLAVATKPITIDTQGFVLAGADGTGATTGTTITLQGNGGGTYTLMGTFKGGNANAGAGGQGLRLTFGAAATNDGVIQGGNSVSNTGGSGFELGGPGAAPTLVNNGTIRGGSGTVGGSGILYRAGTLTNTGTIEGGTGAAAIVGNGATANLSIINSGTIRAGAGQIDAITRTAAATTGTVTLELRAGSVIEGNVVAGATPTTDRLRLGGSGTDSFDVSAIGAAAQYQNFDIFEKTGTGTWLLTGVATTATDWTIYDGTLLIGDHSAASSIIGDITNFGTLGGSGTIFGDVTNSGTISPGNSIGTLTISGNYTGNGGTLAIESVLGGDASPTDRLVVTGNTSGTTSVKVTNLGGGGAQTSEGIRIVGVGGTSAGTFSLLGDYVFRGDQAVVGGAYAYRLYQNGIATPGDGDWYLRSALVNPTAPGASSAPLYQPGVPLYEAYPQLLLALNGLSTLQQRIGDRTWPGDGKATPTSGPDNIWLRTEGMHAGIEPDKSTSGTTYDYDLFKLEGGLDAELYQNQNGRLIGGLTVHYGTVSGDIASVYGDGDIDTRGYGVGATLTWYGENGAYVDAQSQATWYDTDLKSDLVDGAMESGNNGFGYALSLEAGKRFAAAGSWSITPQAQLVYSSVDFDTFNDRFGARVSLNDGDSLVGRLGVALDREERVERADGQTARAKIYGIANLYGEFLDGVAVDVSGTGFETRNDPVWAGLTLGGSYAWNDERYSLYGEVAAKSSLKDFGDSYALSGTAGLRVKW